MNSQWKRSGFLQLYLAVRKNFAKRDGSHHTSSSEHHGKSFGRSGQLMINVTYQYVGFPYADFKLMKLKEDNIDDDLSEYNVEINY